MHKPMHDRLDILAVDFDGTIVTNAYPDIGEVNWHFVNVLKTLQKHFGVKLILWTCRSNERLEEAVTYCDFIGLQFDAVNTNLPEVIEAYGGDTRKVSATLYIDDLAITAGQHELYWVNKLGVNYNAFRTSYNEQHSWVLE